jgi:hypothetical protein
MISMTAASSPALLEMDKSNRLFALTSSCGWKTGKGKTCGTDVIRFQVAFVHGNAKFREAAGWWKPDRSVRRGVGERGCEARSGAVCASSWP